MTYLDPVTGRAPRHDNLPEGDFGRAEVAIYQATMWLENVQGSCWGDAIDLDGLDLLSEEDDILGQLWQDMGGYEEAMQEWAADFPSGEVNFPDSPSQVWGGRTPDGPRDFKLWRQRMGLLHDLWLEAVAAAQSGAK